MKLALLSVLILFLPGSLAAGLELTGLYSSGWPRGKLSNYGYGVITTGGTARVSWAFGEKSSTERFFFTEFGYADFGVASADQVIRALSKGSPVVVIAQLFQINPLQWIYRKDNLKINQVEDIKGKVVGITFGGNDETIMRTLMPMNDISEQDITIFSVRYDYTPFYQKKVDIWPVYRNSQAPMLEKKLSESGESVDYFNPAAHGVKFVANSVVTSKRMLDAKPEIVEKFTLALLKGWEDALSPANESTTLKTLSKFDQDTAPDIMQKQLTLTRSLIKPFKDTRIGSIDIEAWRQTEKIMLAQKQIPNPVYVEGIIRHPF